MKLVRIGDRGSERPYVRVGDDGYIDVSDLTVDFDESFFDRGGPDLLAPALEQREAEPLAGRRIGAPIARPHQILCIGLNYSDHAAESGLPAPTEPVLFTKAPNTLVGPYDDVLIPVGSTKTDWEVELGVVIGRRCRYLEDTDAARDSIAGYVVVNDVSEREWQLERGGQWSKGKSAETFNPCGPWLVTPDEIDDVLDLRLTLEVNGVSHQDGTTAKMLFTPDVIVHYLSQFLVLEPGDLINTGTPAGVGLGMTPPTYLRPGDVMDLSISGLGAQRQDVVAAAR